MRHDREDLSLKGFRVARDGNTNCLLLKTVGSVPCQIRLNSVLLFHRTHRGAITLLGNNMKFIKTLTLLGLSILVGD